MSTEARAPGEDVEGLAKRLSQQTWLPPGCETVIVSRGLVSEVIATLRDLSRKLEASTPPVGTFWYQGHMGRVPLTEELVRDMFAIALSPQTEEPATEGEE